MLVLLLISIFLLGLIAIGLIVYAQWHVGSLEKLGIPVVKRDHFLFGSSMLTFKIPGINADVNLMKKYGTVYGLYHGREPQIFIADAEILRQITARDQDHFNGKRLTDFGEPLFNELIEFQPYKKWKFLRDLTTPVFTNSARLKNSNEAMRASIADFVKDIKEKIKSNGNGCKLEKFNVHGEIHGLLTILIARSQYSIDIGQSGETNPFIKNVQEVMGSASMNSPFKTSLGTAFPFLQKLIPTSIINPEPMREFRVIMKQMLDMRRAENKARSRSKSGDFLDCVLEWYDNLESETYKEIGINEVTIIAHGLLLFLAGQDPMSLVLASLLYHIAKDRDIETTVQQEVDRVFKNAPGGILTHVILSELTYLSGCIQEAVRLYPFFYRSERLCTKDWSYPDKGLHLKKGQVVMIPLAAVNRNPEYFDDSEEFKPERFLPGQKELLHPAAFMSFGFGPRVCPGKRLAMEIMTLVAAYLIREFKFILRSDSAVEFVPSGPFYAANEPIYLDVAARTVPN